MAETTGSATIEIDATPDAVYGILTDLSRISDVSPECYKAEWEGGATGPEVGAAFRGYNTAGENSWDAGCVVVAVRILARSGPSRCLPMTAATPCGIIRSRQPTRVASLPRVSTPRSWPTSTS